MSRQGEFFERPLPAGFSYSAGFLDPSPAKELMTGLLESVSWQEEEIFLHGRMIKSPRLTAWYGDPGASYMYSGVPHTPLDWTSELSELRELVSRAAGVSFNSVLLNLYRGGEDSVSWHSDDESELGLEPTIASVSLGATRRFRLRERSTRETLGVDLFDGSLLLMKGTSQRDWEHCLTKTKRAVGPRINLTFRVVRVGP
jgi:alkylated DNA repair dioxygenase AlkB